MLVISGLVLGLQRAGLCESVFPFAELLSEHRLDVTNQRDFSEQLKRLLDDKNFNVKSVVHRDFKRITKTGLGEKYITYGTLACSQQVIVISDNIEKEGQQLMSFHYNWLFGDKEAKQIRNEVLKLFEKVDQGSRIDS